ncbi:MAG: DUF3480 domain-containing protein [Actinomycetota bacterium]|nr:DUF3480 domain-containing protein [Actinomycetota bacterium]
MATELVPGVVAHAHPHQLLSIGECTSYVTEGMRSYGQAELVMTVPAGLDPLGFLQAIANFAQQRRFVDEGGFTPVGPPGLFGREQIRGVTYQRAWPMEGVPLPEGALAAIPLVGHEMDTAQRFGSLRVLARLGSAFRFFPTAVWCDVERDVAFGPETQTVLEHTALAISTARVAARGDTLTLSIPRSAQAMFAANLPPAEMPLALATLLAPDADSCLVWTPGQQAPSAISLPDTAGACVSGCFMLFVPQQPEDECNMIEDGYSCKLTDDSWQRIRQAFSMGVPFTMPCGARTFQLEWT